MYCCLNIPVLLMTAAGTHIRADIQLMVSFCDAHLISELCGNTCAVCRWMEACLGEELPAPIELEEALRNGVYLAKLGHCFAPRVVPLKKIYDLDQERYKVCVS